MYTELIQTAQKLSDKLNGFAVLPPDKLSTNELQNCCWDASNAINALISVAQQYEAVSARIERDYFRSV